VPSGTGAKGFRYYDWAFVALPRAEDTHGGHHWMLIGRNRTTAELDLYRCWSPELLVPPRPASDSTSTRPSADAALRRRP
jgi:hypothetical protein